MGVNVSAFLWVSSSININSNKYRSQVIGMYNIIMLWGKHMSVFKETKRFYAQKV